MSEGPEVHRIADELNEELARSSIVRIDTRLKKARAWLEEHPGALEGCRIWRVYAAGKNILWDVEGGVYFQFHLLMFGKIRTYSPGYEVPPDRTLRALIVTTTRQMALLNGQVFNIGFGDPFKEIQSLREIGPDICAVPFDRARFLERLNDPANLDLEIAPVLLDQRVAAGLGNYLKSDILFEARINPWTRVRDLTHQQQEDLARAVDTITQRAVRNRGQTVSDEVMERIARASGEKPVRWRDKHWVFRQSSRPCKVCGGRIVQARQGPGEGRVTFFCPHCQQ